MIIRRYIEEDCEHLIKLFYDTVHSVNIAHYNKQQVDAWASGNEDLIKWNERFLNSYTLVAEEKGKRIGFGNITSTGYLDMLYVHKDCISKGVGSTILKELEKAFNVKKIISHSSITAKPFFIKRGFKLIKEQQVERMGVMLTNYVLEKELK